MDPSRRQLLKAAGAVGAASLLPVGSVVADEECAETHQTEVLDEVDPAEVGQSTPVVVGIAVGSIAHYSDSWTIDDEAFADVGEDEEVERRIVAELSWNPTDEGPSDAEFTLQRQNFGGEWEEIAEGRKETTADSGNPLTSNSVELTAVDGEEHVKEANNPADQDQRNQVIVEPEGTYRFLVWPWEGVADIEIEAKVQTFDPDC